MPGVRVCSRVTVATERKSQIPESQIFRVPELLLLERKISEYLPGGYTVLSGDLIHMDLYSYTGIIGTHILIFRGGFLSGNEQ